MTQYEGPRLNAKGRWPKDPKKGAIRQRMVEAAAAYKKRLLGSSGPASKVRRIDPDSEEGRAITAAVKGRWQ